MGSGCLDSERHRQDVAVGQPELAPQLVDTRCVEIGVHVDRLGVSRLITVSDRAFDMVLDDRLDVEAATLGALCDLSERVLVACETAAAGQALARRLDSTRSAKLDIVSLQP